MAKAPCIFSMHDALTVYPRIEFLGSKAKFSNSFGGFSRRSIELTDQFRQRRLKLTSMARVHASLMGPNKQNFTASI